MTDKNTCRKGAIAELKAATWLLDKGYEVFRNMSPEGPFDIIAIKPGETIYIDVKTPTLREFQGEKVFQQQAFSKSADKYPDLNKKILYVYKDQIVWRIFDLVIE